MAITSFTIHPKAFLVTKRNIKSGLMTRTKIISTLEENERTIRDITEQTGLSYSSVSYHLKTLKREKIVTSISDGRPVKWSLTGLGQQPLPITHTK